MINILSDLEIEKIKDNLLERLKEVYAYRIGGHFITFTEYDVIDLFKDVKCAYLLKFGKQEKTKQKRN